MRLTNRLCAQHLGWTFKKHWQVQGKRVPHDTGATIDLQKLGVAVKDVQDVIAPPKLKVEHKRIDILDHKSVAAEDETHPNWHKQACHMYGNSNVLLEGVPQAQLLTNAIEISGFPKSIEKSLARMKFGSAVDRDVQHLILASNVFDAEQVKLPKVKLSERPAYNLPRDYGISLERRNRLLINKLIGECEKLAGRTVTSRRRLVDHAAFSVTVPRGEDLLQLQVNAEKLLTATRPLEPVKGKYDGELPDLYPIKCTITIPKRHVYTIDTSFPLRSTLSCSHPHTIFLHFNRELVGNLHESSVTTTQFQSRAMLKAFAVAASRAKQLYGEGALEKLPKPVVVQSIQTDGRTFHFGVFQLNTLALNGAADVERNYWFHQPNLDLFTACGYKAGRPILEGYNKEVFRLVNAFYINA